MNKVMVYLVILQDDGITYHVSKPYMTLRGAKNEYERLSKESKNAKIIYADKWSVYQEEN